MHVGTAEKQARQWDLSLVYSYRGNCQVTVSQLVTALQSGSKMWPILQRRPDSVNRAACTALGYISRVVHMHAHGGCKLILHLTCFKAVHKTVHSAIRELMI